MSTDYLKPSARGIRDPKSNHQNNGRIVNPPRFAQIGGLSSSGKAFTRNDKSIHKPGDTK